MCQWLHFTLERLRRHSSVAQLRSLQLQQTLSEQFCQSLLAYQLLDKLTGRCFHTNSLQIFLA